MGEFTLAIMAAAAASSFNSASVFTGTLISSTFLSGDLDAFLSLLGPAFRPLS